MSTSRSITRWLGLALVLLATVAFVGCADDGSDGKRGKAGLDGTDGADGATGAPGAPGTPGASVIDASTASDDVLESLVVESEITGVTIASPPQVTFSVTTDKGVPITGIRQLWLDSSRYVRFTITKLVPGEGTARDNWVAYVRDGGEPDYETGASLVDNGDGTYVFTFLTDITNVPGVSYEPTLTHRVAGQIGAGGGLPAQNLVLDFVPAGGPVTRTRNIAVMDTCNECHDNLVFHGRRFEVEYCVNCHNADLASGEGDMSFMIHRIHASGAFTVLDDAIDYADVTYPQGVDNCRKCHNGNDAVTAQGDNWKNVPSTASCDGCHDVFATNSHSAGDQPDTACKLCHSADYIESKHVSTNATPNNPNVLGGQRKITYEMIEATVDGSNNVIVKFRIRSDGTALDVTNLPQDLLDPGRYPGFLLAWAETQDGIMAPADFNNLGRSAAQPPSIGLNSFSPIKTSGAVGTLAFSASDGVLTATITDPASQFPVGARMRTVGLQGYMQQDLDSDSSSDVSLHTPSAVVTVTGDTVRRRVVGNDNCASCHEWFEGHGGNRVYEIAICTMCHVPNLSSSGRAIDPTDNDLAAELGDDPLAFPEDAQNLKDMIHGIHSSGFRTAPYEHVRGGRQGYYDWSEVTFPAETNNCRLCHLPGTYGLPVSLAALPTTVRTTGENDGQDASTGDVEDAIDSVPNPTDWINSPTASACYYCHDSAASRSHMILNGGIISAADGSVITNRADFYNSESCAVCHGEGKMADVEVVHER